MANDAVFSASLSIPSPEQFEKEMQATLDKAMELANSSVRAGGEEMQSTLQHAANQAGEKAEQELKSHFDKIKEHGKEAFGDIGKTALGVFTGGAALGGIAAIGGAFDTLLEKGKELQGEHLKTKQAFMAVGMSAEQAAHAVQVNEEQAEKLSDKYAVASSSIINATNAYLQFGGTTDDLAGKQEIIIGLSQRLQATGMDEAFAMDQAAKMIAKTGGDEAMGGLQKLGIQMPKNATAAERLKIMSDAAAGGLKGLADAADTPAGKMQKLHENTERVEKAVGEGLANAFGTVAGWILDFVNWITKAYEQAGVFRAAIQAVVAYVVEYFHQLVNVGEGVWKVLHGIFTLNAGEVADGIKESTVALATGLMQAGAKAGAAFKEGMTKGAEPEKEAETVAGGFKGKQGIGDAPKEKGAGKDRTFDDDLKDMQAGFKQQESALELSLLKQSATKEAIEKAMLQKKIEEDGQESAAFDAHLAKLNEQLKTAKGKQLQTIKEEITKEKTEQADANLNAISSEKKIQELISGEQKKARKQAFDQLQSENETAFAMGAISEQKYRETKLNNQLNFDKKELDAAKANHEDTSAIELQIATDKINIAKYAADQKKELTKQQETLDKEYTDSVNTDEAKKLADENLRYQNELALAQKFALDKEKIEQIHQQKLHDIKLAAILQQNQIVAMGAAATKSLEGQAWSWIDERVKASTQNQKTVWFALQSDMIKAVENFVGKYIEQQAQRFIAEKVLGATAQAEAIATNTATAAAIGASAAGPASLVATMTFGSSAAAGMAAMLAAAATAQGIGAAAEGGVMVGERGPEFIASPAHMIDYTAHMSQAVASATERAMARRTDVNINNSHQYSMKRSLTGLELNSTVESNSHAIQATYRT